MSNEKETFRKMVETSKPLLDLAVDIRRTDDIYLATTIEYDVDTGVIKIFIAPNVGDEAIELWFNDYLEQVNCVCGNEAPILEVTYKITRIFKAWKHREFKGMKIKDFIKDIGKLQKLITTA